MAAKKGHLSIVSRLIAEGANTDNIYKFFCPSEYQYCNPSNNSCYKNKGKNGKFSSPSRWVGRDGCKYDYNPDILSSQSKSIRASNEDKDTPLLMAEYAGSGNDTGSGMGGGSLKSKRRKTKRRKTKRRKTKRKKTKRKTRKYK